MDNIPTTREIIALMHRQLCKCAYSGDELTAENLSIDHRVPVSDGGGHDIQNLSLVTRQVNAAKGAMSLDEFVQMCGRVYTHMGSPDLIQSPLQDVSNDPVAVLTRQGFVDAAQAVIEMQDELESLRKIKLRLDGTHREITDERIQERKKTHAELQRQIQALQARRSQLLAQTGASLDELRN